MDIPKRAAEIVADAERQLRDVVAAAASAGQYDAAESIMRWARTLASLTLAADPPAATNDGEAPTATTDGHAPVAPPGATNGNPSRVHQSAGPAASRTKRAPAKGEYPKFFRRGDQLVKLGWSKTERAEYEHKAPRRVIDALAAAIARRPGNGRLFTADQLFPLKDPQDGGEVPGYQAYVALAWFKTAGVVKQHGRSGYSVRNASGLNDVVGSSWQRLLEL